MPVAAPIAAGAASAIVGGMMSKGSKSSGNVTSTNTNTPWSGVQPYLSDVFSRGQSMANSTPYRPTLSNLANPQMEATIRGDYLNPSSNPFLQNYVNDALGLVKSNFAGQYGGQAGGNLGNSGYQEMLTRTLANTALPIYANAYGQERQNQLQASQLAPDLDKASAVNPFSPLQAYAGLLNGGAQFGTSTSQQPYFTNPGAGALGGAMAGLQLYNMFPKAPAPVPSPQASYPPALIPGYGG
jgi:hypothetical protein